ncbi:MAG: AAA family ATPase [Thermoplasmata archaeon]
MSSRKEVSRILAIFDEVKTDHGIVLLVYGKEGSGKSYILDEVIKILQAKDVICMKERLGESKPLIFSKIIEQSKKQLSSIANSGIVSFMISSAEAFSNSEKIFLKLTESLTILSNAKPVFMALDDLDDCEISSLNLFLRVARFINNKDIMLVATLKNIVQNTYFENAYNLLKTSSNLVELKIEPLTKEEMKDMLKEEGYTIPNYIADYIYRDSGGDPARIFQVLKEGERNGNLDAEKVWIGHYPKNNVADILEEAKKNRIEKLDSEHRKVLNSIAVLDNNAKFDVLMYMTDFDEMKLSELLDLLIYFEIITEDHEYFKIVSNDLKKHIYESIPLEERKEMHKKYAELLERDGEDIILLSDQYYLAHINDKAARYLKDAGLILMRLEQYETALTEFLKAESISDNKEPELLMYIGTLYRFLGDYKKSIEYLENSKKYAQSENLMSEIEIELADSYTAFRDYDTAIQYYKKLETVLTDKKLKIRVYFGLYSISLLKNDITKARQYIAAALKIAEEIEDIKLLADSYRYIGNIEYKVNNIDLARKNYEQALTIYNNINNLEGLSKVYNNIANIYADTGSSATAIEYYEKAAYYTDMLGEESMLVTIYYNLAELNFQVSKLPLALKYLREAKKSAEIMSNAQVLSLSYRLFGSYYTLRGEFEEAISNYKKSAEISDKIGDKYSFYEMQYEIQLIYILMNGKVDKREIKKINELIKSTIPEKAEIEILETDTFIRFLENDLKNSLKSSKKIEDKSKTNIDLLWSLTYQFSSELFAGNDARCVRIFDKIDNLSRLSGLDIIDTKKIKVCATYLTDRDKALLMFRDVDNFLDLYSLKFEKGKLYMWYGFLKLKYEHDDSYLIRAKSIFDDIKAKAYFSMADHYLKDQNLYPK